VVDEEFATVGTAKLVNGSVHLNFEVSVVVLCKGFVANVAAMLEVDFAHSREVDSMDYIGIPWLLAVHGVSASPSKWQNWPAHYSDF
jgi:cardiolipin synthase